MKWNGNPNSIAVFSHSNRVVRTCMLVSIFISILTSLGCQQKLTIYDLASPIVVKNTTKSISVGKVIVDDALNNKNVGSGHMGLLNIPVLPMKGSIAKIDAMMNNELYANGYSVRSSGTDIAFTKKTDYIIGAIILDLKYDVYTSDISNSAKAYIIIHWQLLDQSSNKIVYDSTQECRAEGISTSTIAGAAKGSFLKVLSDKAFASIFEN
jgi:hypothetical protein